MITRKGVLYRTPNKIIMHVALVAYPAMESGVGVHVETAINHPHVPQVTFSN